MSFVHGIGELLIPQACAGCGVAGSVLCGVCRQRLREVPHAVKRSRDSGVNIFALGDYTAMRRRIIIAMKEYNNITVRAYVGAVIAAGIEHLQARGEIDRNVVLVPAPTRARSARLRGGDPITHICQAAGEKLNLQVKPCLSIKSQAADQSLLSAGERWENMHGAVELNGDIGPGSPVLLVDDVVTTGATLAASAAKLRGVGALVVGGLVLADAR